METEFQACSYEVSSLSTKAVGYLPSSLKKTAIGSMFAVFCTINSTIIHAKVFFIGK